MKEKLNVKSESCVLINFLDTEHSAQGSNKIKFSFMDKKKLPSQVREV